MTDFFIILDDISAVFSHILLQLALFEKEKNLQKGIDKILRAACFLISANRLYDNVIKIYEEKAAK